MWGDNPKYTIGAIKNAKIAKDLFPEWTCRFYVCDIPTSIVDQLTMMDNCETIIFNEQWYNYGRRSGGTQPENSMFWKFYPLFGNNVDAVISRDTDSRLSMREKMAVDEWIKSNKKFHIIRDHPGVANPVHGIPIPGGLWGMKSGFITNLKELIETYKNGKKQMVDQLFLKEVIYPIVKNDTMVHDEISKDPNKIKFPIDRVGLEFIGQVYDENDNPNKEYEEKLRLWLDKGILYWRN